MTVEAASETTDLAVSRTSAGALLSSAYGGGSEDGVEVSLEASGEEYTREASGVSVNCCLG